MSLFSSKLLAWYDLNKRNLPWRHTNDPYKIWVSEVMLQQTQAVTVIPYYQRFIESLPTVFSLAQAEETVILKLWEGLGYYSRVRNMQKTALDIVEKYNGIFPNTLEELKSLKGIGPYTAGAIRSIAFNQKASAIDGNVSRVLTRQYEIESDISKPSVMKYLEQLNEPLIDDERPSDYTQAIIELGATVCRKTQPLCDQCPVSDTCLAFRNQRQSEMPYKAKKEPKKVLNFITFILLDESNGLILYQQKSRLLEGLYLLPQIESESLLYALEWLEEEGFKVLFNEAIKTYKHVFTHLIWQMDVYYVKVIKPESIESVGNYQTKPIATAHKRILDQELDALMTK